MCSDQLNEVSVKEGTPRRRSSTQLNPLAKDFTIGQPLPSSVVKNFTNGQAMAKDFVLGPPPKLWTPPGKDASPAYPSPLPFIPFTFTSPPPTPLESLSFETLNTSLPILGP